MQTFVCEQGTDDVMSLRDLLIKLDKLPGRKKTDSKTWWQALLDLMAAYPRLTFVAVIYLGVLVVSLFNEMNGEGASSYPYVSSPSPTKPYVPSYSPPQHVAPVYLPPAPVIPTYSPPKQVLFGSEALRELRKPRYVRPAVAPNGMAWPMASGYVPGYPVLANDRYCEVTIDNSLRSSDVHVKVVALPNRTVRNCFIRAGQSFQMGKLNAGNYEIKYRDLDTGGLAKSEPFDLQVRNNGTGITYSTLSLTLYTVKGGNTHMEAIAENEF